ncbi:hypothetical protein JZ751_015878 [Albula glossodonta]|uniref:Sm domain-containing protein n=1 Tax=Albula glossodonta TaxID=121402 RepID=A0A8T2N349_9TELE|nr:hypothetical protein JZ751_015878 [Albula glossodonta]
MVLEDVTEFEITPEGRRITKLDQILLNGNNITMLIPGGEGPEKPRMSSTITRISEYAASSFSWTRER